jgi:hypothetical protein
LPATAAFAGWDALDAVLAALVAKRLPDVLPLELEDDVAFLGRQRLGLEAEMGAVLEVDGGEFVDEEFGVLTALPELKLDDQFGGVLKDSPSRGSQSHTWAWPLWLRLFFAIAIVPFRLQAT